MEDEFLAKLAELRKTRVIYVYYGHVMARKKDINGAVGNRSLTSFDPILVLFEYMKLQNMRLIDLFRSIDTNGDKVISREELQAVFLVSSSPKATRLVYLRLVYKEYIQSWTRLALASLLLLFC